MRFPGKWPTKGMTLADNLQVRQQTTDFLRNRGTLRKPLPPRDVFPQSGPRGVFLVWSKPQVDWDIVGWRVYKGDENTLYHEIRDRGTRQMFVESTGATASPSTNLFVSSLNSLGLESVKVQVQGKATNEAGAPTMPSVPPGYNTGGAGGGNKSSGMGRTKYSGNTP